MSLSYVTESRAYDSIYDPVFANAYRDNGGAGSSSTAHANANIVYDPTHVHQQNPASGATRHKFFRRPMVPFLDTVQSEVLLAPVKGSNGEIVEPMVAPQEVQDAYLLKTKEMSVQTDYRDSEAQTDPYAPNYKVSDSNPQPNVLLLQDLHPKDGNLPEQITMYEYRLIEHRKRQHLIQSALPPVTDEASMILRKKILEYVQIQNLKLREEEIDRNREARLGVIADLLNERDEANEFANEQRVESIRQEKLESKDLAVANIQVRRLQVIRKLMKKRASEYAPVDTKGRNVISDYANTGSKVYVSMRREGDAKSVPLRQDPISINPNENLQKIDEIHRSCPRSLLESSAKEILQTESEKAKMEAIKMKTDDSAKRTALKESLDLVDKLIKENSPLVSFGNISNKNSNKEGGKKKNIIQSLYKSKKIIERPATPRVPEIPKDASILPSILLLQSLLRGRAEQNMMVEGRERRRNLIAEIRRKADTLKEKETSTITTTLSSMEDHMKELKDTTVQAIIGDIVADRLINTNSDHHNENNEEEGPKEEQA